MGANSEQVKNQLKTKKRTSLRRMVLTTILLGAFIFFVVLILVEMLLFIFPTMQNYKREMRHEAAYIMNSLDMDYVYEIFDTTKAVYYGNPEEVRVNQLEDEYRNQLIPLVDESFMTARRFLMDCKDVTDMTNIFFAYFDDEYERLVMVVDSYHLQRSL